MDTPDQYHGYSLVALTKHMLIITQTAPLNNDEKFWNQTDQGKKLYHLMYLNDVLFEIKPKSQENREAHGLGKFVSVIIPGSFAK